MRTPQSQASFFLFRCFRMNSTCKFCIHLFNFRLFGWLQFIFFLPSSFNQLHAVDTHTNRFESEEEQKKMKNKNLNQRPVIQCNLIFRNYLLILLVQSFSLDTYICNFPFDSMSEFKWFWCVNFKLAPFVEALMHAPTFLPFNFWVFSLLRFVFWKRKNFMQHLTW